MSVRKIFMTVPTLQYVTIRKEDTTAHVVEDLKEMEQLANV